VALEVITLAWAIGFASALIAQRSVDSRAWSVWESMQRGPSAIAHGLRESLVRRTSLIGLAVDAVQGEAKQGDDAQATRLFQASVEALQSLVADLVAWLQAWSDTARTLMALAPTVPLSCGQLRLRRLRVLTLAWKLAHAVTITRSERYLLRTFVLAHALRLLLRFWRRTRLPGRASGAWLSAEALKADLGTLSEASVETYDALQTSLRAVPRARVA
jgi:hypothetical protein